MPNPSRPEGGRGAWTVVLTGLAVAAWWAIPLAHPRGAYGGGYYRFWDIEIGVVAAVAWLARLAVALAPPGYRRPLALRLITALGAVLVATVLLDVAAVAWSVRFGHLWYRPDWVSVCDNVADPELVWRHRPLLSWRGRKTPDCDLVEFRTDEHGFRNPPGLSRADVVFVGDSVTEAGEVAEGATFARKAAGALGLRAANLGVFGYGPQQELAVLKRYGFCYRPRAVVWQVTEWNDPIDAERYLYRDFPAMRRLPSWRSLYETHSPIVRLIAKVFPPRPLNLVDFRRSDGVVDRRRIMPYFDPSRTYPVGMAVTRQALAEARGLCRDRGIAFAVLFAPHPTRILAPYVRPRTPAERDRCAPAGGFDRPDDSAHVLADDCRRLGCPLLDLTPALRRRAALDNRRVFVRNDVHLGADGHDEAARAVAGWLASADGLALAPRPAARR